jgi:CRP/FNR family cyclic AMP-dependent transcriptional regulator
MKPQLKNENSHRQSAEKIISTHPFLAGMSPHQLHLIRDYAMPAHFTANEVIFREGDPANRFYLIESGRVAIESEVMGTPKALIQTIGPGEVLGWSWLFPPYFWHFDARALDSVDAIFLYGTPLREECESDHELGYELMKRLAEVMVKRLQSTRWKLLGAALRLY